MESGVSLLQACAMMDLGRSGFLDRSGLRRLLTASGVDMADWGQDDLILRCDTTQRGINGVMVCDIRSGNNSLMRSTGEVLSRLRTSSAQLRSKPRNSPANEFCHGAALMPRRPRFPTGVAQVTNEHSAAFTWAAEKVGWPLLRLSLGWTGEFTSKIVSRLKLWYASGGFLDMVGGLAYRRRGSASWRPPTVEKMASDVGPCLRFVVHVDLKLSDFQANDGDWPAELSALARCCLVALWRAHGAYYRCSISCAFRGEEGSPGTVVTLFRQFAGHFAGKAATEHQLLTALHGAIAGAEPAGRNRRPGKRAVRVQQPLNEDDDLWSLLGIGNSKDTGCNTAISHKFQSELRIWELAHTSMQQQCGNTDRVAELLIEPGGAEMATDLNDEILNLAAPDTGLQVLLVHLAPVGLKPATYELTRSLLCAALVLQSAAMACAAPPSSPTGRAAEVETEIEDNGAADDEDEAETGLPADEVDEELVEVDTVETIERLANMQHPSADRATPSESSTARTADYSVPEQSKEVWKHFGCDTEAGRMLRKLYKGAGSRELGSKISYPQLATPATRWQPPPKAKPAAPKERQRDRGWRRAL
eukprot:s2642_g4.t1